MIVVDVSLILLAADKAHPLAGRARAVLDALERGDRPFRVAATAIDVAATILGNEASAASPAEQSRVEARIQGLISAPQGGVLAEGPEHWQHLRTMFLSNPTIEPTYARLAAICVEHGVRELWTLDTTLSWLPTVRVASPI